MGYTDDLSDRFFRRVCVLANRLPCDPEHLLAVWFSESIGLCSGLQNQFGADAWGINQMTTKNIQAAGWPGSTTEYLSLSAEQQLPYVETQVTPYMGLGKLTSAARIYQANFLPNTLDLVTTLDGKIAVKDGLNAGAYSGNKDFDREKKGFITLRDLQVAVDGAINNSFPGKCGGGPLRQRWMEIKKRLAAAAATSVFPQPPGLIGEWLVTTPDAKYRYVFRWCGEVLWAYDYQPTILDENAAEYTLESGKLKITWEHSTEFWDLPISPGSQTGTVVGDDGSTGTISARKLR